MTSTMDPFPADDEPDTIFSSTMSGGSSTSSLEHRIHAIKKAIRKATDESLKAASLEETLPGVVLGPSITPSAIGNGLKFESYGTDSTWDQSGGTRLVINDESRSPTKSNSAGKQQSADEESCTRIDDARSFELGMALFGDNVSAIEHEMNTKLGQVEEELRDIVNTMSATKTKTTQQQGSGGQQPISEKVNDKENEMMMEIDEETIEDEAQKLQVKINFLRQCSQARILLDESTTMSLSSDGLVESAKLLSRAIEALNGAETCLKKASLPEDTKQGRTTNGDIEAARRIVESIRIQIRRKRVDLQARATSILDSCIKITPISISVRGGVSPLLTAESSTVSLSKSRVKKKDGGGLAAAYDTIEAIASSESVASNEYDGISNKLEDIIHIMYKKLYDAVLDPVLSEHQGEGTSKKKNRGAWQFHESNTDDSAMGLIGSSLRTSTKTSSKPSLKGPVLTLEWRRQTSTETLITATTSKSSKPRSHEDNLTSWGETLQFLRSILAFVHERVLLKRSNLCRIMGRFFFGDNSQKSSSSALSSLNLDGLGLDIGGIGDANGLLVRQMLRIMWDTCIPSHLSSEKITSLHGMATTLRAYVDEFERDLLTRGFLIQRVDAEVSTNKENNEIEATFISSLSEFASNFEQKYAEKRRCTILADGRELLLTKDYHNTLEVGVDVHKKAAEKEDSFDFGDEDDGMSVFVLHKCAISQVASLLMDLCRKTMDEAVDPQIASNSSSLEILPPTLYRTARELMDLFRAIIPAAHGSEISTIPRTAAVLHNDCVYFAHNLLTLGLEYKEKFPPVPENDTRGTLLRQMCTFVDLVPLFRELADRSMGEMIERQKYQLVDIVGSRITILGDALRSNESVVEWSDAETALTAGLYHFRHLSQAWKPILSDEVYARAMGNLVDTLFMLYLDQVMKATDISEPASHFASALFRNATRAISELFDGSPLGKDGMEAAKKSCNLWDRFVAVGRFMDMSLADINIALAEGVFRSVTAAELSRLIMAAFDDSEKRRQLLQALQCE